MFVTPIFRGLLPHLKTSTIESHMSEHNLSAVAVVAIYPSVLTFHVLFRYQSPYSIHIACMPKELTIESR